jgi:hypothetical protein
MKAERFHPDVEGVQEGLEIFADFEPFGCRFGAPGLYTSPVKVENHLKGATLHDWASNVPSMPCFPPDFGDFGSA